MTPVEISIGASGYNWWDLVPAIVGGFAGAVAGGIASYVLAVRGSREIRDRDSDDRLQRTRARVFRTFSEFVQIFSSFGTIYENVITQLRLSSCRLGDHAPNQRAIRPLANLGSERLVTFDADDIAPFFEQQIAHPIGNPKKGTERIETAEEWAGIHLHLAPPPALR